MRTVIVAGHVPGLTCHDAFDRLADFSAYPTYSEAVRSVQTRQDNGRFYSDWEVNFREGILRWSEEDLHDRDNCVLGFVQTAGDIDDFRGEWSVHAARGGALVRFTCSFDMGIPGLADILDPIAELALRDNAKSIIAGLMPAVQFIAMEDA